ncbi:MAG: hypothetical protein V3T14_08855 [Myxococcota bacterium]
MHEHLLRALARDLGQVVAHRTVEPEQSILDQAQDQGGGHGLLDRRDREDRVDLDRWGVGLGPELPEGLVEDDHAPACHQGDDRRSVPALHPVCAELPGPVDPLREHPGFLRRPGS